MDHSKHIMKLDGHNFDLDDVTKQLEKGNTAMLESALGYTHSQGQREEILKAVQGMNSVHRVTEDPSLPKLSFHTESDFPSSWGENLVLMSKNKSGDDKILYVELDSNSDGKDHRRVEVHHPQR